MLAFCTIPSVIGVFTVLSRLGNVLAANSFAGSNLYYAAGLMEDDRTALLQ